MGEQDSVWSGPGQDAEAPAFVEPPPPTEVLASHFEDFKANLGGYLVSGLGFYGGIFLLVLAILLPLFLAILPGLVLENDTLAIVGAVVGWLWYFVAMFLVIGVFSPLMTASFLRAVDTHRRQEMPIGFLAAFSSFREEPLSAIGIYLIAQLIIGIGAMFCYVPGLLCLPLNTFAVPMVVLDRRPIGEALSLTFKHMTTYPAWHLIFHLLLFGTSMLLELIPLVGLLLVFPWLFGLQLAAYRAAFGQPAAEAA